MEIVPQLEIIQRIERLQKVLAEGGLDGAFILQNTDLYYFSGTIQPMMLFVPSEGEVAAFVLKNEERILRESPLRPLTCIRNKSELPALMADLGMEGKRAIGLELDVLPAYLYLWFCKNFPQWRWTDISDRILSLRMIKSGYEVEQIRRAAAIMHKGFEIVRDRLRPGMTELEVDGILAHIARCEGHMGILRMRGWNQEMTYAHVLSGSNGAVASFLNSPHGGTGTTPAMAQGAGFRKIGKNEPVGVDYGVGVNGYVGDQYRTFVIGKLPGDMERAHRCSVSIHHQLAENGRPGVSCKKLYDDAIQTVREFGLEDHFMGYGAHRAKFVGHGIGLEIDEHPVFTPGFDRPLKEGMVVAIEPEFVFPGRGIVGLEDDYLVTPGGLERLTLTKQEVLPV